MDIEGISILLPSMIEIKHVFWFIFHEFFKKQEIKIIYPLYLILSNFFGKFFLDNLIKLGDSVLNFNDFYKIT